MEQKRVEYFPLLILSSESVCIALVKTVEKRFATNSLNNNVLRALQKQSTTINKGKIWRKKFHERGSLNESADLA